MPQRKPLTNEAGEVRELDEGDFEQFRPAADVLAPELVGKLVAGRQGGRRDRKERLSISLSRDVVERFRATGDGWESRLDAALREWLETHSPA